jgi:hypothetical protein
MWFQALMAVKHSTVFFFTLHVGDKDLHPQSKESSQMSKLIHNVKVIQDWYRSHDIRKRQYDDDDGGFQIPKAESVKMAVFWVVAPCTLVWVYRRLRVFATSIIAFMIEAANIFQKSVNFYQTTRHYNEEDSHFHHDVLIFMPRC